MSKPPRPRYPRSHCCIIGCRRTSTLFGWEWLCAEHWRPVPRSLKALRTRLNRKHRRRFESAKALYEARRDRETYFAYQRANSAWVRTSEAIWKRMKAAAFASAAGI